MGETNTASVFWKKPQKNKISEGDIAISNKMSGWKKNIDNQHLRNWQQHAAVRRVIRKVVDGR